MKKRYYIYILFFIALFPFNVMASTNTFERTKDNLQVWDSIVVTDNNIDDILATPKVDEKEKIYDFADLFSDEEEKLLFFDVSDYIERHNMDMVIVTTNQNTKLNANEYAKDFFDYNYFGKNDTFDGILYILDVTDPNDREVYISTSGKAILIYDDARIDDILDSLFPSLVSGKYYYSADKFVHMASEYADHGIPDSNKDYEIDANGNIVKIKSINFAVATIGSLIIASVVVICMISRHKGIKLAVSADNYIDSSNIKRGPNVDIFVTTHTTTTRINTDSGGSGGSHGGGFGGSGSSISRGSSGRSHGGGGRHF